jgi:hypothetical protein
MKIIRVETLLSRGFYSNSPRWKRTRLAIHQGVRICSTRDGFLNRLEKKGWAIQSRVASALGRKLGRLDAVAQGCGGPIVVEWKTGDISSSYLSLNKMALLLHSGAIAAGTLVIPSQGRNIEELESCFPLWRSVPCENGALEIVVTE